MSAISPSGLSSMRAYQALSEAAAGTRYLVYYRLHNYDEAEQQLLRRLMWLLFAGAWYVNPLFKLWVGANLIPAARMSLADSRSVC